MECGDALSAGLIRDLAGCVYGLRNNVGAERVATTGSRDHQGSRLWCKRMMFVNESTGAHVVWRGLVVILMNLVARRL